MHGHLSMMIIRGVRAKKVYVYTSKEALRPFSLSLLNKFINLVCKMLFLYPLMSSEKINVKKKAAKFASCCYQCCVKDNILFTKNSG